MGKKNLYPIAACFIFVMIGTGIIGFMMSSNHHSQSPEPVSHEKSQEMISENRGTRKENARSSENSEQIPVVAPMEQNGRNNGYVLEVMNGNLQVIDVSTHEVYMETEIRYEQLPEDVRKSIDTGRYFSSLEELLAFLESYSS